MQEFKCDADKRKLSAEETAASLQAAAIWMQANPNHVFVVSEHFCDSCLSMAQAWWDWKRDDYEKYRSTRVQSEMGKFFKPSQLRKVQ